MMLGCTAATAQTKDNKTETPVKTVATEETVYNQVDQMPEYPGGQAAMIQYIQKNLMYPQKEKEAGIQGMVLVSFIVEKDGSMSKLTVVRGVPNGEGCDNEALRLFKTMPKWTPGKKDGQLARVQYNFPIKFTLTK